MDWSRLLAAVKKHLWIIILVAVCATGGGWALSRWELAPVYQSRSLLMVIPHHSTTQNQLNGLVSGQQLVATYTALAKSPAWIKSASTLLRGAITPTTLAEDIQVTSEPNTNLILVVASAPSSTTAMQICRAVSTTLLRTAQRVTGSSVLREISPASRSPIPVSIKPRDMEAGMGLIGLVGALAVVLVLELLNDSIVTVADATKFTELPVLAEIPWMPVPRRE